jgi:predicted metal-dependent enzyme (double-stranded beta helix superfamily)
MSIVKHLVRQLSAVTWEDRQWRKEVFDILRGTPDLSSAVNDFMLSWDVDEQCTKDNGSHETSTHYKWLIHRDVSRRFTLWVHDYKPAELRQPGYAEVPHNHRYDLCSIILSGGYTSVLYDVSDGVVPLKRDSFAAGDVLSLSHHDVHSLTDVSEGTLTLFVEGPTVRNFSSAFPPNGPPRHFVDFNGRRDAFLERLGSSPR